MTAPLVWDLQTLNRFWAFHSQNPESYFSYSKSADVVRRSRSYLRAPMHVLDYGCGPGFLLPHLLKTGCDVWGGEISDEVVGEPARSIPTQPTFHGIHTINSLLGKQEFGAITLLEVIEHLDDHFLDEVMSNIDRMLKREGIFIVTTPNDENLDDNLVYCPVSDVTFHRLQHMRSWSSKSLSKFFEDRGCRILQAKAVNFRDERDASSFDRKAIRKLLDSQRKKQGLLVVAQKI